jgi:hypothetical protein
MKKSKLKRWVMKFGIAVIIILLIMMVASQEEGDQVDLGWYDVADWEIAVCSGWGGIADDTAAEGGELQSSGMYEYTSLDISIAIQAQVKPVGEGIETPAYTNIYEISWYVQPVAESVNYEVIAKYIDGGTEVIQSGSATPYSNYDGYQVKDTDRQMTSVVLRVPEKGINQEVIVVE